MICNADEAMCIAGVFGGAKSGVSETTTSIFLESAYFNAVSVRKTAKRFGLKPMHRSVLSVAPTRI
jgi:phenylalanyl-tRNA synthetase beta chain